jgi:hypothetical protein
VVKKWIWRAVKGGLLLALVLVLGLTIALITRPWWRREWAPRHCEANLVSHWPLLKLADVKRDSAFDLLQRAGGEQPKISGSAAAENLKELNRANVVPWSAAAFPNLTRTLAEGAGALALARSAASAANPQVPTYTSPADRFDYAIGVLRLSKLFRASAAHRVSTGDIAVAYAELETAIAFAGILSRGGALLPALVDITCDLLACRTMRLIALQNNVPPEVAGRAINCLLESDKSAEPLAETFRQEYRAVPTMLKMFFDPRGQTLFGFDEETANSERQARWSAYLFGKLLGSSQERVTADLADVYRCLVNLADGPYDLKHLQRFEDSVVPSVRPGLIRLDDPVGYIVAKIAAPGFTPIIIKYCRRSAELRATAVVLALRQYQRAEQHLPQTLQDLVPKYLSEVPVDPFDGKSLRYRVRTDGRWIVYSVGPNQLDENGEQPKGDPREYTDPGDVIFCECEPENERARLKIEATSK